MSTVSPESRILSLIKQDHLTCQICHGPYEQPKALPCLHTYCCQCLRDFIFSRRYEAGGSFPCPVCRVVVELTKDGVDAFPDNHLVITLMDTVAGDRNDILNQTVTLSIKDNDNCNRPCVETSMADLVTPPPSTGLYPRLTPLLERKQQDELNSSVAILDIQNPRRIEFSESDFPVYDAPPAASITQSRPPKPQRNTAPISSTQRTPTQADQRTQPLGYHRPTNHVAGLICQQTRPIPPHLQTRPVPAQRKLQLSPDQYPIQVEKNRHGAILGIGQYGSGLADFDRPVGLAVSPEGYIIVGDQRGNRVFIFERCGKLRTMFTCQGQIQDLATNGQGLIYIANTHARKSMVVCYNCRGHTIATFGNFFTYEKPHGIAVMSDNHMVITSTETHIAYMLNEYGKMTHKFTGKGKDGKRLQYPYHVCVSRKDKIIISDNGNDCIKIFDNQGKCKVQFGKSGNKPGQLNGPRGVCVDKDNNIVVCDSRNHRVQVFSSRGQFIRVVMAMTTTDTRVGAFPMNMALTQDNKLVVLLAGASYAQVRIYSYVV